MKLIAVFENGSEAEIDLDAVAAVETYAKRAAAKAKTSLKKIRAEHGDDKVVIWTSSGGWRHNEALYKQAFEKRLPKRDWRT